MTPELESEMNALAVDEFMVCHSPLTEEQRELMKLKIDCFNKGFKSTIESEQVKALVEGLRKTIKENTIMLTECSEDNHDWEPDSSLTVFRCDKCGIGLNTFEARKALEGWEK